MPAPRPPATHALACRRPLLPMLLALALPASAAAAGGEPPPAVPPAADAAVPPAVSSPAWEEDMRRFAAEDAARPPPRGAVLFVGGSSIRFWDLAAGFPGVATVNRGFGGSQLRDSTYYANRIVIPYAPRLVVLHAGDNDLESGRTPRQVREDFRAFVERVRRGLPQARIAYLAIKPSPARAGQLPVVLAANAQVRAEAARWQGVDFIDVATPMLGADGQPRPELFGEDRLHLNARGYELWRGIVAPYLAR